MVIPIPHTKCIFLKNGHEFILFHTTIYLFRARLHKKLPTTHRNLHFVNKIPGTHYVWILSKSCCIEICRLNLTLSALFKVDGALRRVGGENDYIYYAGKCGIHQILKK